MGKNRPPHKAHQVKLVPICQLPTSMLCNRHKPSSSITLQKTLPHTLLVPFKPTRQTRDTCAVAVPQFVQNTRAKTFVVADKHNGPRKVSTGHRQCLHALQIQMIRRFIQHQHVWPINAQFSKGAPGNQSNRKKVQ